ncbi:TauD/TfdA dioxygenase family protein [Rhabdothermincola salaria]|uniref:TauD/TfdA dioxygenase family protein n=1 Tax=Rhabdothermincola salaria TaxID=2903142 RepID=UPI001E2924CA|nr:TauD/TfdA family dioxygenase [Rhabdothermincola salaria]MCD9622891.1 TauD/TfdA family dioxygenase [Rhabdothermincola salaria]
MTELEVRPLTTAIGAEIGGVDLRDVDDATAAAIRTALDEHLVVFFRDQRLEPADHLRFAQRMGTIDVAPFGPKHPDHPEITVLDQDAPRGQGADSWHTDNTYLPAPPLGSILRAVQLPDHGGDTLWASMYAAYEGLSPPVQQLLDGLTGVHDLTRMLRIAHSNGQASEALDAMQAQYPPQRHPVVRTNPVTGRKALFVSRNWVSRIEGLTERENEVLLPFLFEHVRDPAFQVRFSWRPGSMAMWDNRWVQHYAVADYTGTRRIMHRITLTGDVPV